MSLFYLFCNFSLYSFVKFRWLIIPSWFLALSLPLWECFVFAVGHLLHPPPSILCALLHKISGTWLVCLLSQIRRAHMVLSCRVVCRTPHLLQNEWPGEAVLYLVDEFKILTYCLLPTIFLFNCAPYVLCINTAYYRKSKSSVRNKTCLYFSYLPRFKLTQGENAPVGKTDEE